MQLLHALCSTVEAVYVTMQCHVGRNSDPALLKGLGFYCHQEHSLAVQPNFLENLL